MELCGSSSSEGASIDCAARASLLLDFVSGGEEVAKVDAAQTKAQGFGDCARALLYIGILLQAGDFSSDGAAEIRCV